MKGKKGEIIEINLIQDLIEFELIIKNIII